MCYVQRNLPKSFTADLIPTEVLPERRALSQPGGGRFRHR
jgi:hypothetical protein